MTAAPRPGTLVLLRHGESEWNKANLFTGWVDVPLSDVGRVEAARGGELLVEHDLLPDVLHTSLLKRAISTAELALAAADRQWIPVRRSWRLNERHYGALQGKDKKQTLEQFGEEQFMIWRRSYDVPPPPIEPGSEFDQEGDPRYAVGDVPRTECLADVVARFLPYWESAIVPDLRSGKVVLLAAGAGEAPRRDLRRGHRRTEHPHGHPAALRARRRAAPDGPGRHVPRPGGSGRGRGGGGGAGPLTPPGRPLR